MHNSLAKWVEDTARITRPRRVEWCDGSEEERARLVEGMLNEGTLVALREERLGES